MIENLIILIGILSRLLPHIPNSTPVTASALFGGVYLSKKLAVFIPLFILIISDYLILYINPYQTPLINFSQFHPLTKMFHSTTLFVWGSFIISGLIGIWLRNHNRPKYVFSCSLVASVQFFIITNFGVWATTNMYPHTLSGLTDCYLMGLAFYRFTLLGDLFYTGLFFGTYKLLQNLSILKSIARR